jgi:hypothetical protein
MSDENRKNDIKVEKLQQDVKDLTTEEAKEVKGGLKMAPARASEEDKPKTPGI